ncbi:uncharacterized protein LTHEOB_6749 [Lasiodiplodia theobromae]|uniref:uncharacterized protein n=1 Tax=Lasiodiplodia theobromae TaxID=45133 RepID=UPI0015C3EC71|nr:uncharacterized protein LTHEOB_6749 [Lasiodiplodia theobromae]KAF4544083.1 hypothetical protein LTHEOB_6749 [Lasiodiplodia theobromae]
MEQPAALPTATSLPIHDQNDSTEPVTGPQKRFCEGSTHNPLPPLFSTDEEIHDIKAHRSSNLLTFSPPAISTFITAPADATFTILPTEVPYNGRTTETSFHGLPVYATHFSASISPTRVLAASNAPTAQDSDPKQSYIFSPSLVRWVVDAATQTRWKGWDVPPQRTAELDSIAEEEGKVRGAKKRRVGECVAGVGLVGAVVGGVAGGSCGGEDVYDSDETVSAKGEEVVEWQDNEIGVGSAMGLEHGSVGTAEVELGGGMDKNSVGGEAEVLELGLKYDGAAAW